jgi:hypothetical protein
MTIQTYKKELVDIIDDMINLYKKLSMAMSQPNVSKEELSKLQHLYYEANEVADACYTKIKELEVYQSLKK